jgi:hypothetical protein
MSREEYFNIGAPIAKTSKVERRNPGPYVGIVKGFGDPSGMNRIAVYIPALQSKRLSSETTNQKQESRESTILCNLLLPYYGRTNRTGNDAKSYAGTSKSYGMWFPTPDIDSLVMVIFADGKQEEGYIIGGVPEPYMLHMVPGIPTSPAFHPSAATTKAGIKSALAGGNSELPVAEFNRQSAEERNDFLNILKPLHPLADILISQGLQSDYARGLSTSGAQRESPSNVFGVSTPGPLDPGGPYIKQGLVTPNEPGYDWPASRSSGHTFVMDDGDYDGQNRNIRLRTGTGHQILLNDTDGIIYIGNATGSTWVEMTNEGQIDVFSKQDVSVHTEGNMNFLADKNIHIQSGEDLVMLAGHNLRVETNPSSVSGKGHAHFFINGNMKQTTTGTYNIKTTDWFNVTSKEAISVTSLACIFVKSGGGKEHPIKLNTEAGNVAEEASHIPLYEKPWVTLDDKTGTYKVDGTYQYTIGMQRVPMHEPDARGHEGSSSPAAGTTPHITEKPTGTSTTGPS